LELAGRLAEQLDTTREIRIETEIEAYASYLSDQIARILEETVPLRRPSRYAQLWWNPQVAAAVQEAKRAQRRWLRTRDQEDRSEAARLGAVRAEVIRQAKQASFRQFVSDEAQGEGLWRLSKWSKSGSKGPILIPPLQTSSGLAETFEAKTQALVEQFFPSTEADLSDIPGQRNREEFEVEQGTTLEEITAILNGCSSRSAPGSDGIPFHFLKALGEPVGRGLILLASASLQLGYLPVCLKVAKTVILRKPGKSTYEAPSAWRPIALLKIIGKVVEKLIAKRIREAAEAQNLLYPSQMGARANRSTGTAFELLTSMVQTIWGEGKDQVATLLSLDISGVFPIVNYLRLIAIIRKLGFLGWVLRWVQSFLDERKTILVINGVESQGFPITAGLPQGSPLSPILFLLYIDELIRIADKLGRGIHTIGFVDDLNLLVYSKSTEQNCANLSQIHRQCEEWARRHGMQFAPYKYELMHFTIARKKHNLQASIQVGGAEKAPISEVRVLGVWLDPKLKWQAHTKVV
jgi:hypothetical protein